MVTLTVTDSLHTAFSIQLGLAVEFNPAIRLLLKHGIPVFVAGKIAIVGALI